MTPTVVEWSEPDHPRRHAAMVLMERDRDVLAQRGAIADYHATALRRRVEASAVAERVRAASVALPDEDLWETNLAQAPESTE